MALFGKKNDPAKLLKAFRKGDRYRKLDLLGEGGLARVSGQFDSYLNRVVAVKELKEENFENPHLLKLFVNEAKLIGYLDHPGVISVYDTFLQEDGALCYTMKLNTGRKLTDILAQHADAEAFRRSLPLFLDIFVKLCETMAYAHDRGVVHLDLKPDNIMIGRYGEVMIMDWGNARLFDRQPYEAYLKEHVSDFEKYEFGEEEKGMIVGTPLYMSPEQTNSSRDALKPASDIFSLGVVFYEMMSGRTPFVGEDVLVLMSAVRSEDPMPLHEVNPDVPRRISQICSTMLEKGLTDRYVSCKDVLKHLIECRNSGQAFAVRQYLPGATIFREGEPGTFSFTILDGRVEIFKETAGRKTILAVLGKGEIVGEVAIFSKMPRTATARAIDPTTIRIMVREDIEKELEKLSPWVGQMLTGLCQRFAAQNERIVSLEGSGPGA
jgi:serine/threonine-protein kinase